MASILVPIDLSANSIHALEYAIKLNEVLQWKLVIFHCSYISADRLMKANTDEETDQIVEDDRVYKTGVIQAKIDEITTAHFNQAYEIIIESNEIVVDSIIELSERIQSTMIVMGSHGASGIRKVLFGSNTAELISKSEIPVLAIPENHMFRRVDKIVFCTDLEDFPRELKQLLPFGEALRAPIHVMYLDYGPGITSDHYLKAQEVILNCGYKDILLVRKPATIELPLVNQISDAVELEDPAWLVMFTRPRGFWDTLFKSSKTTNMSYSMKIPLLSFKKAQL